MTRRLLPAAALLVLTITTVPAAGAATKPGASTGGASNVVQQSARVSGTIDPNGAPTTYVFQYGPTTAYGATTPELTQTGDGNRAVSVDLGGLTPATKYHYRLVARNAAGQTTGADRTFTTLKVPLGLTLTADPNPVRYGAATVIRGQVTGTDNAGVTVALQGRPFPFTLAFGQIGNAVVAAAQGGFAFTLGQMTTTTQYRVVRPGRNLTSPIVTVSVQPRLSTAVSTYRVRRGGRVTFSGTLTPALPGTPMALQRRSSKGTWILVTGMASRSLSSAQSRYRVRTRIRSTGTYRIYAGVQNGTFVPVSGREVKIRVR